MVRGVVGDLGAGALVAVLEAALKVVGAQTTHDRNLGRDGAAAGLKIGDEGSGRRSRQETSLFRIQPLPQDLWVRSQFLFLQ